MEEDIKTLEELLKASKENDMYEGNKYFKSLEYFIKEYQDLKEIEESHRKENGELRERVKKLKEERQIVGMPVRNKRDGRIGIVLHQWKSGSVAVLESINPRVINTHDSWNTLEIVTDEVKQTQTKCETIPVSLVEEKIEEINKAYEDSKDENGESQYYYPDYTIRVLEELLEKKDKMIDEIQEEVLDHIGFENRLKRDNRKPNLFNQGRFYVANNINNILKGK